MEQDINIAIEQYKQTLIDATNKSGLPIGIIKYVFNELNTEVMMQYNQYMQQKMREATQAEVTKKEALPADEVED